MRRFAFFLCSLLLAAPVLAECRAMITVEHRIDLEPGPVLNPCSAEGIRLWPSASLDSGKWVTRPHAINQSSPRSTARAEPIHACDAARTFTWNCVRAPNNRATTLF